MMCAAERSQLATISVRTPARSAFVRRLSQIAGTCLSHACVRRVRRLCNCARVCMINLGSQACLAADSASMRHYRPAAEGETKAQGPGIFSPRSRLTPPAGRGHSVSRGVLMVSFVTLPWVAGRPPGGRGRGGCGAELEQHLRMARECELAADEVA